MKKRKRRVERLREGERARGRKKKRERERGEKEREREREKEGEREIGREEREAGKGIGDSEWNETLNNCTAWSLFLRSAGALQHKAFLLQVHYSNEALTEGIVDSSGFRVIPSPPHCPLILTTALVTAFFSCHTRCKRHRLLVVALQ